LQAVYRNPAQPLGVRIRCAVEALPYESPKLSAVAVAALSGNSFAAALDRAIARSRSVLMIESKAVEPAQPELRIDPLAAVCRESSFVEEVGRIALSVLK
jgi:hypothetical protein